METGGGGGLARPSEDDGAPLGPGRGEDVAASRGAGAEGGQQVTSVSPLSARIMLLVMYLFQLQSQGLSAPAGRNRRRPGPRSPRHKIELPGEREELPNGEIKGGLKPDAVGRGPRLMSVVLAVGGSATPQQLRDPAKVRRGEGRGHSLAVADRQHLISSATAAIDEGDCVLPSSG